MEDLIYPTVLKARICQEKGERHSPCAGVNDFPADKSADEPKYL